MKKIRVYVDIPWAGVDNIEEDYELPEGWDQLTPEEQNRALESYGAQELDNTGIGYGAEVVEVE
jgi:hypothetical protein